MGTKMSNVRKAIVTILSVFALIVYAGHTFAAQTEDVTVTVTVRYISLQIVGASTYDFGVVGEGQSAVATSSIQVQNDGNDTEDFSLQITGVPAVWTVEETAAAPGADEFKVYALFDDNGQVPDGDGLDATDYDEEDLVLQSSSRNPSNPGPVNFYFDSGDESGDEIPTTESRYLWFMFTAPNPSSDYTQQSITVTVSASVD